MNTTNEELFDKILVHHNLGKLKTIKPLTGGYQNSSFLVNNKFVIRITSSNNFDDEKAYLTRFQREAVLYRDIFPQRRIPTPKCYGLGISKELIPEDYIILSYLTGEQIDSSYQDLDKITKQKIAYEVGNILKDIHSIKKVNLKDNMTLFNLKSDWKQSVLSDFYKYYEDIQTINYIGANILKVIETTLHEYENLEMGRDIPIYLVHFDFHGQHIMVNENKVEAFFDFEWAQLGDPYWDLQLLPINFSIEDFETEDFLIGYGKHKFTHSELVRLKFYAFWQGIWQIWAVKMGDYNFPEESAQAGIEMIEKTINFYTSYK